MKMNYLHISRQYCLNMLALLFFASICCFTAKAQGVVTHPVSEVTTSLAIHTYTYYISSGYKTIRYFIIEAPSGNIKTAFDACDVCYFSDKGFSKLGTDMQCNNCGNQYAINGLGTENIAGGCWPGYLPRTIENGNIVLNIPDIETGHKYFPFISGTSGINSSSMPSTYSLMLYDNELFLNMTTETKRIISLFSINGQSVYSTTNLSGELSINTSNITSGIYLLYIQEADKVYAKRFIIK